MKILIAPDKFKGSLTAEEACEAIRSGFSSVFGKEAVYDLCPLSDGGDGFLECLVTAGHGRVEQVPRIDDSLLRPCLSELGWIEHGRTAAIEIAKVCGLASLDKKERKPLKASTRGVRQLILHA